MTRNFDHRTMNGRRSAGGSPRPPMTERELDAYLLSREALRRIRRTSAWLGDPGPSRPPERSTR
jgi:hypothetical protein